MGSEILENRRGKPIVFIYPHSPNRWVALLSVGQPVFYAFFTISKKYGHIELVKKQFHFCYPKLITKKMTARNSKLLGFTI